jgi:hypothetical protein
MSRLLIIGINLIGDRQMTSTKSSFVAALAAVFLTALAFQQALTVPVGPGSPTIVQIA